VSIRLYVETNFILSISTGRDPVAFDLINHIPANLKIAIPSICCLEALSVLEAEKKRRRILNNQYMVESQQLSRDRISTHAQALAQILEQAQTENKKVSQDRESSLHQTLNQLADCAELIPLTNDILKWNVENFTVIPEATDNLILACILADARLYPENQKVLLSGNSQDFQSESVKQYLAEADITNYFKTTQSFLGWFNTQAEF
jgi:rRNA-processing protein FCF1